MPCSSGCRSQSHESYGACLRAKNLEVQPVEAHKFNRAQENDIKEYGKARRAGIQPATLSRADVEIAWKMTDKLGVPFRADAQ
jgi:hypothetical protein